MNKNIVQIIIVEDDPQIQEMYQTTIDEFNIANTDYEIQSFALQNDSKIPQILYNHHIDAIIIDLDWGSGSQENEGNSLVQKIYNDCRVPIFVVSGNLHLLTKDYEASPIFKKYQRDEVEFYDLLTEITLVYETGYTKVLGNSSEIDKMLSKVFWEYMFDVLDCWADLDSDIKNQRMLRFAITRINEILTIDESDKHDDYDALEFYIKPAIKEKPFTGDIIEYNHTEYIVITAACDMEQNNSDFVVLCQIDFAKIDDLKKRIKENSNKAEKELAKYINNGKSRYHLLPPCSVFSGGLIDFQIVNSVSKEDFTEHASVIASVNPVFVKDIQSRFSHYYGRQGQPQLCGDNIIKWIKCN